MSEAYLLHHKVLWFLFCFLPLAWLSWSKSSTLLYRLLTRIESPFTCVEQKSKLTGKLVFRFNTVLSFYCIIFLTIKKKKITVSITGRKTWQVQNLPTTLLNHTHRRTHNILYFLPWMVADDWTQTGSWCYLLCTHCLPSEANEVLRWKYHTHIINAFLLLFITGIPSSFSFLLSAREICSSTSLSQFPQSPHCFCCRFLGRAIGWGGEAPPSLGSELVWMHTLGHLGFIGPMCFQLLYFFNICACQRIFYSETDAAFKIEVMWRGSVFRCCYFQRNCASCIVMQRLFPLMLCPDVLNFNARKCLLYCLRMTKWDSIKELIHNILRMWNDKNHDRIGYKVKKNWVHSKSTGEGGQHFLT